MKYYKNDIPSHATIWINSTNATLVKHTRYRGTNTVWCYLYDVLKGNFMKTKIGFKANGVGEKGEWEVIA